MPSPSQIGHLGVVSFLIGRRLKAEAHQKHDSHIRKYI
jgi:hypothetical protein